MLRSFTVDQIAIISNELNHLFNRFVIYKAVSTDRNYWNVARKFIACIWDAHAVIYHGYEVIGMENLPKDGSALIVYYHGAIPIDMYYLVAKVFIEQDRLVFTISVNFNFKNIS